MSEQHLELVHHNFEPIYNEHSKILILGTFPSVKSREQKFYYGHKQNRFWKMLAGVLQIQTPETIEEKKKMLLEHRIAIWDVIASCEICGSSDASIRNVVPNDISKILCESSITKIIANGTKAYDLYEKYSYPQTGMECIKMPSTSPANAAWTLERLIETWSEEIAWQD